MPRVYYGLTSGAQTYRFTADAELSVALTGTDGTAFELYSDNETDNDYIPAVAVKVDDSTIKIIIQGDYNYDSSSFTIVNMITGDSTSTTISGELSLQDASSLADYPAVDNKEKQITVINNLETNSKNIILASLDINSDGVYNWIEIGNFVDGKDGQSIYIVTAATYSSVMALVKINDNIVAGEVFTADGTTFAIGDVYIISALAPLTLVANGNIRGPKGDTGDTGANGQDGTKVISDSGVPDNGTGVDGDTYIDISTWNVYLKSSGTWTSVGNIKGAPGTNGTNGQNGQSFQMQSGLYSTPDNWGQAGNVDGDGNPLLQLPTLPQANITGKGYVVYDPLTTPLAPFYDLYYANNGDVSWTIIHPFSGIAGQDGADGETPYISGGTWWIGSTNTGVSATGPQGPTGATPQITTSATPLPIGSTPTVSQSGTAENPVLTFGIPVATRDYIQIGFTYDQTIPDSDDKNIMFGWQILNSNGNSLSVNNTDRGVVIGSNINTVKVTFVAQMAQNSTTSRFSVITKINNDNYPNEQGTYPLSYVRDYKNIGGGSNFTMQNTFIADVNQGDVLTFFIKSNNNVNTDKDKFIRIGSHIIVEVLK